MKLNRRKSLMAIIGGIAGAPQAAKAAMETKLNFPPSPGSQYDASNETLGAKIDNDGQWEASRIKQLQKTINGEFEEYQIEQLKSEGFNDELYYTEIDSLKSVSPVNKKWMVNKARIKHQRNRWKQKEN